MSDRQTRQTLQWLEGRLRHLIDDQLDRQQCDRATNYRDENVYRNLDRRPAVSDAGISA